MFKKISNDFKEVADEIDNLMKDQKEFFKKNRAFYDDYENLPRTIEEEAKTSILQDRLHQQSMLKVLLKQEPNLELIEKTKQEWLEKRLLAEKTQRKYAQRFIECKEIVEGYEKPYKEKLNKLYKSLEQKQELLQCCAVFAKKALFTAVKNNEVKEVKELVSAGLNIELKNVRGLTPLFYAIKKNNAELVQCFLEAKANPNLELELKKGPSITPLIATIIWTFNNTRILELLLQYGAIINKTNNQLNSPLHVAISMLAIDHACYLLRQGASTDLINSRQETPLNILEKRKHIFWHKEIKTVVDELKHSKSLSKI